MTLWQAVVLGAAVVLAVLLLVAYDLSLRRRDERRVRHLERTKRLYRGEAVVFDWDEPEDRERLGRLGQ